MFLTTFEARCVYRRSLLTTIEDADSLSRIVLAGLAQAAVAQFHRIAQSDHN